MQDYLFVSFSLDDEEGDETCRLLSDCRLLEAAIGDHLDREAWLSGGDRYISLRLPWNDDRLHALLESATVAWHSTLYETLGAKTQRARRVYLNSVDTGAPSRMRSTTIVKLCGSGLAKLTFAGLSPPVP